MFKDYLHFSIDLSVYLPVNIIQPTIEVFWKKYDGNHFFNKNFKNKIKLKACK